MIKVLLAGLMMFGATSAFAQGELICGFHYLDKSGQIISSQYRQVSIGWGQPVSSYIEASDQFTFANVSVYLKVPPFNTADVWITDTDLKTGLVYKSSAEIQVDERTQQKAISLERPVQAAVNGIIASSFATTCSILK